MTRVVGMWIGFLFLALTITLPFQNCGKGFEPNFQSNGSAIGFVSESSNSSLGTLVGTAVNLPNLLSQSQNENQSNILWSPKPSDAGPIAYTAGSQVIENVILNSNNFSDIQWIHSDKQRKISTGTRLSVDSFDSSYSGKYVVIGRRASSYYILSTFELQVANSGQGLTAGSLNLVDKIIGDQAGNEKHVVGLETNASLNLRSVSFFGQVAGADRFLLGTTARSVEVLKGKTVALQITAEITTLTGEKLSQSIELPASTGSTCPTGQVLYLGQCLSQICTPETKTVTNISGGTKTLTCVEMGTRTQTSYQCSDVTKIIVQESCVCPTGTVESSGSCTTPSGTGTQVATIRISNPKLSSSEGLVGGTLTLEYDISLDRPMDNEYFLNVALREKTTSNYGGFLGDSSLGVATNVFSGTKHVTTVLKVPAEAAPGEYLVRLAFIRQDAGGNWVSASNVNYLDGSGAPIAVNYFDLLPFKVLAPTPTITKCFSEVLGRDMSVGEVTNFTKNVPLVSGGNQDQTFKLLCMDNGTALAIQDPNQQELSPGFFYKEAAGGCQFSYEGLNFSIASGGSKAYIDSPGAYRNLYCGRFLSSSTHTVVWSLLDAKSALSVNPGLTLSDVTKGTFIQECSKDNDLVRIETRTTETEWEKTATQYSVQATTTTGTPGICMGELYTKYTRSKQELATAVDPTGLNLLLSNIVLVEYGILFYSQDAVDYLNSNGGLCGRADFKIHEYYDLTSCASRAPYDLVRIEKSGNKLLMFLSDLSSGAGTTAETRPTAVDRRPAYVRMMDVNNYTPNPKQSGSLRPSYWDAYPYISLINEKHTLILACQANVDYLNFALKQFRLGEWKGETELVADLQDLKNRKIYTSCVTPPPADVQCYSTSNDKWYSPGFAYNKVASTTLYDGSKVDVTYEVSCMPNGYLLGRQMTYPPKLLPPITNPQNLSCVYNYGGQTVNVPSNQVLKYTDPAGIAWNLTCGTGIDTGGNSTGRYTVWAHRWFSGSEEPTYKKGDLTFQQGTQIRSLTHKVILQYDGNLVVYKVDPVTSTETALYGAIWALNQKPAARVEFQADGNFVFYDVNNNALGSSKTTGAGENIRLQKDGNLTVLNSSGQVIWGLTTNGPYPVDTPPSTSTNCTYNSIWMEELNGSCYSQNRLLINGETATSYKYETVTENDGTSYQKCVKANTVKCVSGQIQLSAP